MHIYKDIIMLLSYPTLRAVLQVGLQAAFFFLLRFLATWTSTQKLQRPGSTDSKGAPKGPGNNGGSISPSY